MPITFVQTVGTNFSNTLASSPVTLAVTVPAGGVPIGHHLIVVGSGDQLGYSVTVADSKSNTYQSDVSLSSARGVNFLSSKITTALVSGDTITITFTGFTGTNHAGRIAVYEFSGLATTAWFDKTGNSSGTSTAPSAVTSAVTSQANELVMGAFTYANAGGTMAVGSGYTLLSNIATSGNRVGTEYKLVSATGLQTANGTIVSAAWSSAVATYKDATAGGAANKSNFLSFM